MRLLVLLASLELVIAAPAAAQLIIQSLEATHRNGTLYHFPQIGGDSAAAVRINTFLQAQELEKLPGQHRESPFEDVWPSGDSHNGLIRMDYSLAFLQPGILKVDIVGEFYAAYLTAFGHTYHFDARTGQLITMRDLLTPDGLVKANAEITAKRLQQVEDFLAGKKVGVAKLSSDPELAAEQKGMYENCRGHIEKRHPVTGDEFRLEERGYVLVREPCGPRVQRALDELDLSSKRFYEDDQALLSDYGRCLLIERRAQCQRGSSGITPGVYLGKIGERYPITLVIERVASDGRAQAWYSYDEHDKVIELQASAGEDGHLVLAEHAARFALSATPDGGLTGEWTQEGKPPQKVDLR